MIDEANMSQESKWFHEERAKTAVNNLQKRNIYAQYVSSRQEALTAVLEMIPPEATVARGDSVTLWQIGILSALKKRGQKVIYSLDRDDDGSFVTSDWAERLRIARETFSTDVFLAGTNAVTLDGKLVNVDGGGNRVAPMLIGPEKVVIVAGVNKIVKDVNEALERIHNVAAPLNAKRHYLKHHNPGFGDLPCVRTGRCFDCDNAARICRYTVIIEGTPTRLKGRINVVLVGEDLGI